MLTDRLSGAGRGHRNQFVQYATYRNLSAADVYDTWDYPITSGNRTFFYHPSDPLYMGDTYQLPPITRSPYVHPPPIRQGMLNRIYPNEDSTGRRVNLEQNNEDDAELSDESDVYDTSNLYEALNSLRELKATTTTDKLTNKEKETNNNAKEGEEKSQSEKKTSSVPKMTNEDIPPTFRWVEIEIV